MTDLNGINQIPVYPRNRNVGSLYFYDSRKIDIISNVFITCFYCGHKSEPRDASWFEIGRGSDWCPARLVRKSAEYAWTVRWWSLLSVAAQRSFGESLIVLDASLIQPTIGLEPELVDVYDTCRHAEGPLVSRLGLRG